ncbi:hypothetical protein B0H10DRAFT_1908605 [Mycena sp. CBHHK59/15]|nr:hypothetical protein B0H10DRAFT_1908605 [Mycena sp. CBHHK59/15]
MACNKSNRGSSSSQSEHLQHGQACFNCRRRKMRCDGSRPICGQCSRANRPDDCEYTDGQRRARAQILQESINRVESRIYELEHPHQAKPEVLLRQPYKPSSEGGFIREITPQPSRPQESWAMAEEPPINLVEKLIDTFLPYSSEFGFFLNATRLRQSALMPYPMGHHPRPSPALLTTIYLWGLRLSNLPHLMSQEPVFLSRALKLTAQALSGIHPQKVMHTLQAEVLLSYFFFASGRFLEGKYHTAAAISLGLSSGLNLIRSAYASSHGPLPPPRDAVEEGERIHACWIGLILDKSWSVALGEDPNMEHRDDNECVLDTPWPLEMEDYEKGRLSPTACYSHTFQKFITGSPTSDVGMSTIAMLAKGTLLWQRADALMRSWKPYMSRDQTSAFLSAFSALDKLIDNLRAALIPPHRISHPTPAMTRTLVVAHSIAHAAMIQLHAVPAQRGDAAAKHNRLLAARAVLDIVAAIPLQHFAYINPIMGTVWLAACQTVVDEMRTLKALRTTWPGEEEAGLTALLSRAMTAITTFSATCPLLKYQISVIQQALISI